MKKHRLSQLLIFLSLLTLCAAFYSPFFSVNIDIEVPEQVNNGKDFTFPIHSDSRDKLLSVVVYIAPKINEGTWLYDDKSGTNPRQIEWKQNRAFGFSRNDNTWHSYKADGKSNRLALVYNLRSDKYWKK